MSRSPPRTMAKSATNVSIRRDLLDAARASGFNLSATLEEALMLKLTEERAEQWRVANREAIEHYNENVLKHGVFSDGSRSF